MYLKVKNKLKNYNLIGKKRNEVRYAMEGGPDHYTKEIWCYVLENSWLKKTLLFIEFEEEKASHLSSRVMYINPLSKSTSTYIDRQFLNKVHIKNMEVIDK
ncbi:hypothetical protein [Chryseobacterium viscerum]|uniref:hypothetical protein n=1 Tax=Chryseobacterium viscerum TaxID=1037377 RepID=UPI0022232F72|nr:hypothetical protein [Chryseobacterium viscerum]